MKKNIISNIKFLCIIILCLESYYSLAQKLPNKQEASIYLPGKIKIDGNGDDWGNQFQAYNHATDIYYSIANDDANIYLIVQAIKPRTIEKIMDVGIAFTISSGEKTLVKSTTITYPIISGKYTHDILIKAGDKANYQVGFGQPEVLTRTDSSVTLANKVFNERARTIKITGGKTLTDTLFSVYNELGVKVATVIDNKGYYTQELIIPLKYIEISNINPQKITYDIKLNDWGRGMLSLIRDRSTGKMVEADPDLNSITNFSGEYTFAKKP